MNKSIPRFERRVSADSVIVIDQVEYEVDYRFAKQRITLRYTPDMKDIFIVEADGSLTPIRLLNKHDNASVKRDKVRLAARRIFLAFRYCPLANRAESILETATGRL